MSRLRAAVGWSVVGQVSFAASQWIVIALLTRKVTADELGAYVYVTAYTAPLLVLFNLSLRTVLVSGPRGDGWRYRSALKLRYLTTLCFVIASLTWGWFTSTLDAYFALAAVVIAARSIDALAEVRLSVPQSTSRMDRVGRYWLINSFLTVAAFWVGVRWFNSLVVGGALSCLASTVALAYLWPRSTAARASGEAAERPVDAMKGLARGGAPLAATMFLVSLNASLPRFQLESVEGLAAVAVLAAVSYFGLAAQIVLTGVGEALLRPMSEAGGSAPARFLRYLTVLLSIGVLSSAALLIIVYALGERLMGLAYGRDYVQYAGALVPAAVWLAPLLLLSALGFGLTALRLYSAQIPILLVVLAATAGSGWWLIPDYGVTGGLAAQGIGASAGCAIAIAVTVRALQKRRVAP